MELLKLNLRTATQSVVLIAPDGKPQDYELYEMTGTERDAYLETLGKRMARDKDGKVTGISNYKGLQADLVSRCLYKKGEDKPVPADIVQSWPASALSALFTAAQKLNQIGETEKQMEEASKNESKVSGETGSK